LKRTILAVATALALAGAMLLPMTASAQAGGLPGTGVGQGTRQGGERGEKYPEMREAMMHLRHAKAALEKGARDFGGHRVAALEHTNKALAECEEALKYANGHEKSH
jgi:hypothetical protein